MQSKTSLYKVESADSFRTYLQKEFVRRCKENPRYSLRAFARQLELEPSLLSKLLNSKRRITPEMIGRLAARLGLSPELTAIYLRQARLKNETTVTTNDRMSKAAPQFDHVSNDHFEFISDWYHYAILELTEIRSARFSPRWVARALDISVAEATSALDRLVRLGYLKQIRPGVWKRWSPNYTTLHNPFISSASREHERQVLKLAHRALDLVPSECRDQTSLTVACDASELEKVRDILSEARRQVNQIAEQSKNKTHVYNVSLSFYPVTTGLLNDEIEKPKRQLKGQKEQRP